MLQLWAAVVRLTGVSSRERREGERSPEEGEEGALQAKAEKVEDNLQAKVEEKGEAEVWYEVRKQVWFAENCSQDPVEEEALESKPWRVEENLQAKVEEKGEAEVWYEVRKQAWFAENCSQEALERKPWRVEEEEDFQTLKFIFTEHVEKKMAGRQVVFVERNLEGKQRKKKKNKQKQRKRKQQLKQLKQDLQVEEMACYQELLEYLTTLRSERGGGSKGEASEGEGADSKGEGEASNGEGSAGEGSEGEGEGSKGEGSAGERFLQKLWEYRATLKLKGGGGSEGEGSADKGPEGEGESPNGEDSEGEGEKSEGEGEASNGEASASKASEGEGEGSKGEVSAGKGSEGEGEGSKGEGSKGEGSKGAEVKVKQEKGLKVEPLTPVKEEAPTPVKAESGSGRRKQMRLGSFFSLSSKEELEEGEEEKGPCVKLEFAEVESPPKKKPKHSYTIEDFKEWGKTGGKTLKRQKNPEDPEGGKKKKRSKTGGRFQPGMKERLLMIGDMKKKLGKLKKGRVKHEEPSLEWFREAAEEMFQKKCDAATLRGIWRSEEEALQWQRAHAKRGHCSRSSRHGGSSGAKKHTKHARGPLEDEKETLEANIKLEEEHYGHELCPEDIVDMWKEVIAASLLDLRLKERTGTILEEEARKKVLVEKRYQVLCNKDRKWQVKDDVMNMLQRKELTVARKTALSAGEEKHRMKLTWMDFDEAWDIACFRPDELETRVTDREEFLEHREDWRATPCNYIAYTYFLGGPSPWRPHPPGEIQAFSQYPREYLGFGGGEG